MIPERRREISALVDEKVRLYPELAAPLSMSGLRQILRREDVALIIRPHHRLGQLIPYLGSWTIMVDSRQPARAQLICAVHELCHLWLHHDPFFDRRETTVYDRSPEWYDDARELEADVFTERMIAGPDQAELPIRDSKRARKATKHRASQIPLGTRQPPPSPKLPAWLEDVERDADAIRLRETAHAAAREDAARYPVSTEPRVSFTIRREAWQHVHLPPGHGAGYSPMVSVPSGTEYEYVECDLTAARTIVEQIARAGHRREAVLVRRRIRESESGT